MPEQVPDTKRTPPALAYEPAAPPPRHSQWHRAMRLGAYGVGTLVIALPVAFVVPVAGIILALLSVALLLAALVDAFWAAS